MNKPPLVSVFMPVFNQERLVSESIESVINQTFDDWELVIVDDCSVDDTFAVASSYANKIPGKVKVFRNVANLGITGNCNEVLGKCSGKYIAFTAGDDVFLPSKLEKQVRLMEKNDDCVLSYHDVEVFKHETDHTIRFWNSGDLGVSPIFGRADVVVQKLITHGTSFMAALSVMTRRDAIPVDGYDVRVPVASDWLMWIEIIAAAQKGAHVEYIPEVLARYRRHEKSVSINPSAHAMDPLVTLSIIEHKYPYLIRSIDRSRGWIRYGRGISNIISGKPKIGRKLLFSSIKFGIYSPKLLYWILVSLFPGIGAIRR